MKFKKALEIINFEPNTGFMVSFEIKEDNILRSDYFPEKHLNEPLIASEEEAWELAEKFAKKTNENYVNIYVIDSNFMPVKNYNHKMLKRF